jgi:hypothetical protein
MWYTAEVRRKAESHVVLPQGVSENQGKRIPAIFYRTEAGGEPVREWLKELSSGDRKGIGEDIKSSAGPSVCQFAGL